MGMARGLVKQIYYSSRFYGIPGCRYSSESHTALPQVATKYLLGFAGEHHDLKAPETFTCSRTRPVLFSCSFRHSFAGKQERLLVKKAGKILFPADSVSHVLFERHQVVSKASHLFNVVALSVRFLLSLAQDYRRPNQNATYQMVQRSNGTLVIKTYLPLAGALKFVYTCECVMDYKISCAICSLNGSTVW